MWEWWKRRGTKWGRETSINFEGTEGWEWESSVNAHTHIHTHTLGHGHGLHLHKGFC